MSQIDTAYMASKENVAEKMEKFSLKVSSKKQAKLTPTFNLQQQI